MTTLASVIHQSDNSIEATWVREVTPAIEVPESTAPDTLDSDGSVIPGEVIPAHTILAVYEQVKCHSYHPTQMQMLRDDIAKWGGNIADHAGLIAAVEAAIVPPTSQEIADRAAMAADQLRQESINQAISADTVVAQLKAMTNAEFDTWWTTNVSTAAQAITVLKRITRIVLRRVA